MTKFSTIGLCYHPTSTVLIDDDRDFLVPMSTLLIKKNNFLCYLYDNPQAALHFLNEQYQADPFINHCIVNNDENNDPLRHVNISLDITTIHKEIYNPNRFKQIANLVVDYAMPGMDGAEFYHNIRSKLIKKTLLTGAADKDLAVQFFNDTLIDKFIMKNAPDLDDVLPHVLLQMQQDFFLKLSEAALSQPTAQSQPLMSCLSDPAFIKLFNDIHEQAKAVEYYILDNQGSFLFLDGRAKLSWLIVVNEEEMNAYAEIARYGDASSATILALENKTMLPYFPASLNRQIPPSAWDKYLHPAKTLTGQQRYYYAYMTDVEQADIQTNKILSFQTFFETTYKDYWQHSLQA